MQFPHAKRRSAEDSRRRIERAAANTPRDKPMGCRIRHCLTALHRQWPASAH
jgi:hypothetical protein